MRPLRSARTLQGATLKGAWSFALITALPMFALRGVIPYTEHLFFSPSWQVQVLGQPTGQTVAWDILWAMGLSIALALVFLLSLVTPAISLTRSFAHDSGWKAEKKMGRPPGADLEQKKREIRASADAESDDGTAHARHDLPGDPLGNPLGNLAQRPAAATGTNNASAQVTPFTFPICYLGYRGWLLAWSLGGIWLQMWQWGAPESIVMSGWSIAVAILDIVPLILFAQGMQTGFIATGMLRPFAAFGTTVFSLIFGILIITVVTQILPAQWISPDPDVATLPHHHAAHL